MKAFTVCDRRRDNKCIQSQHDCVPWQRLIPGKCWRMCREGDLLLQCPKDNSRLWEDVYSKVADAYFCPKCNKDIPKGTAIQTLKLLNSELTKHEKLATQHARITFMPSPREFDTINATKARVRKLKEMIHNFARNSK